MDHDLVPGSALVNAPTLAVTAFDVRANRFDLLSRLADDLAHEIKNPLHAAVINLELLKRRIGGDAEEAAHRILLLEEEVALVNRILEGLFQLLRPERPTGEPVEIDAILDDLRPVLEAVGRVRHVQIDLRLVGAGTAVQIAPADLRHAVMNLAANAFESMHPGGGRLEVRGERLGDHARIIVRDTGPGLDPGFETRIGERGNSGRDGHAGLGLAVARALVEREGGEITIEETGDDEGGAAFAITLPRLGAPNEGHA